MRLQYGYEGQRANKLHDLLPRFRVLVFTLRFALLLQVNDIAGRGLFTMVFKHNATKRRSRVVWPKVERLEFHGLAGVAEA